MLKAVVLLYIFVETMIKKKIISRMLLINRKPFFEIEIFCNIINVFTVF